MVNLLREFGPDYVEKKLQRGHEQRARVRAGSALAGGDYGGASRELYGAGMLAEGSEAQVFGQGQEDRVAAQDKARKAEALGGLVRVSGALELIKGADPNTDDPDTLQKRHATLMAALPLMDKIGINTDVLRTLTPDQLITPNLRMVSGNAQKELQLLKGEDGELGTWDGANYRQVRAPQNKPNWKERTKADGSTEWFDINADAPSRGADAPAASGGFNAHIGGVLKREGGFVGRDGNSGAPANYGINQKHNPDIDVRNLTPEKAAQIYKTRYWDAINGDQLPAEAQAAVFDAAVNQGPQVALQMWQQSGGDVGRFNDLRRERYRQTPGFDKYGKSWMRRVDETAGPAIGGGSIQGSAPKRDAPPSGYRYGADGNLTFIPGGPADPATAAGPKNLRPIPAAASAGITANRNTLSKIDKAIAAIEANPRAMGAKNYLGDAINQRTDPGGVNVRALVSDIGSQKIHDRSGAAVTAAEQPRLMPFIPQATDTPQAAVDKLKNLRAEYEALVDETEAFYGPDSGYRPLAPGRGGGQPTPKGPVPQGAKTAHQARIKAGKIDQRQPLGSEANPYVARDAATLSRLRPGSYVITPEGAFGVIE